MSLPLVSIGALNYNNGKFVLDALNSVAAQTYPNIEFIIVDDGSKDNSLDLIKEWLRTYDRPYQLIEHVQNKGIHQGYKSIIDYANGTYLSIFATDDMLAPEKTQDQVNAFSNLDEDYGVVYGDMIDIDECGKELRAPSFVRQKLDDPNWELPQGAVFYEMVKHYFFYVQAATFRMSVIKEHSFHFPENFTSEDWYFLLFMTRKSKVCGTERVATQYRVHGNSLTHNVQNNDKYHNWALSNTKLFISVSKFAENTRKENERLSEWAHNQLMRYAYHSKSSYSEAMKVWLHTLKMPGFGIKIKSLVYINWFKIRRMIGA